MTRQRRLSAKVVLNNNSYFGLGRGSECTSRNLCSVLDVVRACGPIKIDDVECGDHREHLGRARNIQACAPLLMFGNKLQVKCKFLPSRMIN